MIPKSQSSDDFGVLPETPEGSSASTDRRHSENGGSPGISRTGEAGAAETLDRVRDLLFGDASRAHERRLEALQAQIRSDLERLDGAVDERVTALRAEMRGEVDAILGRLDAQGRDKVERGDLRSMLSDLADRIGGRADEGEG